MLRSNVLKLMLLSALCSAHVAALADQVGAKSAIPPSSEACSRLTAFHAPSVEITTAEYQPAGPFQRPMLPGAPPSVIQLPAHCRVTGVIDQRTGIGGKPYGIRFEMRLPLEWNHRFLFQGGGGINGAVRPAVGMVKGPAALAEGYAVVSQDAGHEGSDASFGDDQQARLDMIDVSYVRVTRLAKELITAFYGKPAAHSYFMGCSEGGREALLAAQRMPLEYDGVVAGDPGFLLGVSFDDVADRMVIAHLVPKGSDGKPEYAKAFSAGDLKLFENTIEAECDAQDGLADGIIANPEACHPKLERLICKGGHKTDRCLSAPQVHALRAIFDGGQPSGYHVLAQGYYYNTAVDLPQWHGKLAGFGGLPTKGVDSIQGLFITPYDPGFDDSAIDFAKEGPRFTEVGNLNRTDGVDYSSFRHHGAKLLIYTGTADQAFSAKTLVGYYNRLAAANGGLDTTRQFSRLYLVPGMTHCAGGKSLDDFDPLQAMVDWVETDKAPARLLATGRPFPGRSRPLCAYPEQSRYTGTGSIDAAENFECRLPTGGAPE